MSGGKWKEECGIFGFFNRDEDLQTAEVVYCGIFALQHRGQESCGIAVCDHGETSAYKGGGLVSEVFDHDILSRLDGNIGVGHVRYPSSGSAGIENTQPLVIRYRQGSMSVAGNGNICNARSIKAEFEKMGFIFQTDVDAEVVASMLSRERISSDSLEDALVKVMGRLRGSYSMVIMSPNKLIAARDPMGIRPLVLGKRGDSHVVCSESCALTAVGAEYVRDVEPGEILVINKDGLTSIQTPREDKTALCIFEFIYFARTDSVIDGADVYEARVQAGRRLASEHPIDADAVIGVPDSGIPAAVGYARQSGIRYAEGFVKNRYVGRTFIQPGQSMREHSVAMKISALKSQVEGKRIIMIDDSIVRGTTSRIIVQMLKDAGAKKVHMLVSSPPVKYPCHFGIDTSNSEELIANVNTHDEICAAIGVDSLGYISLDGLLQTPVGAHCEFCKACFDGEYPLEVTE